jgi:hypothetical protein
MIQRIGITLLPCKHGASLITAALKRCADQSSPDKEILN